MGWLAIVCALLGVAIRIDAGGDAEKFVVVAAIFFVAAFACAAVQAVKENSK